MSNEVQHRDDDYLPCQHYQGDKRDENGFYRFEENGKFYFSFIDHGIVALRSEGYSNESGRENGIASVMKNMSNEDMYSTKLLPDGRWILSLKAGNHQEIARSCPEDSEEEAKSYLPSQRALFAAEFLRLASIEAGTVPQDGIAFADDNKDNEADDYMICREYEEHYNAAKVEEGGFIRFQHENTGKYYFAWVDETGDIILRSEGYPTTAARDNGMESVRKNRTLEERYRIEESHGVYFLLLKAGNHQEIGRSCPFRSEAEAKAFLPSERAARAAEMLKLASVEAGTVPQAGIAFANEEDDYMICREYQEKFDANLLDQNGFIRFQHENTGKYYFAWYNKDGEVILRSEGYPTTAARDNGMESVLKNRDIPERMKVEEKRGLHYLVLKAGNHQEIGRSCPKESESALWALVAPAALAAIPEVEPIVPDAIEVIEPVEELSIAAPLAAAAGVGISTFDKPDTQYKEKEKEDDYLACNEYKGYGVSDKTNNIAFFKHKNGQFYFVVYHKDGSVRLRSEGFKTAQDRDQELKGVIKHLNDDSMYENIEKSGYIMRVLRDKTGREVGRSCPEKAGAVLTPIAPVVAAAATAAAIVATPKAEQPLAPVATKPVVVEKSGFNWWWLLLPLLLLSLFLFWKSCGDKKAEVTSQVLTEPVPAVVEAVKEEPKQVEAPVAPSCDLNWILFDFDKYDIKSAANDELQLMAKILKDNPSYKGVLKAFTDARGDDEYNQKLSANRANEAKNVLVAAGIESNRIDASAFSESAPIAKNTDDDSGRRFNRRVELYVQDANGNDICKSIPPAVPVELKGN